MQKRIKPRNSQYILSVWYLIKYTLGILLIEISHFYNQIKLRVKVYNSFNVHWVRTSSVSEKRYKSEPKLQFIKVDFLDL